MRKIFGILLLMLVVLSCATLTACSKKPEDGTVTRVEIFVNPDVEFMVDSENKVVAVTALNDDGSVLISGEVFVGLDYKDAVEKYVSLAKSLGYLLEEEKNNVEAQINVSVSGATAYAKELKKNINSKIDKFLKDNKINASVKELKAMTVEELRKEAVNTSMVTEEEAAGMNEKQLLQVLSASRIETAELLTKEMRDAYYRAKEHKISFAEKEEVQNAMEGLTGAYQKAYSLYSTALLVYSSAIQALDDARYNYLVSPESEYQKALQELREQKTEIIKERTYTMSLNVDDEEYASATLKLKASEEDYDRMLANLEQIGTQANTTLENLITKLKSAETALNEVYKNLPLPADFEQILKDKAKENEAKLNALKDNFFEEFEQNHKSDLDALASKISEQKQKLLDNAKSNK